MSVPLACMMSPSKLIHYFSSHPVAFGIQASSLSHNITLNPVNKKTDHSLSFQAGIGAAAHATLDTECLILIPELHLLIPLTLQDSDGGMNQVSEVHKLLTKIHDILDNVVSKCIHNTAHILAYLFNSAFRQCYKVWTSQFPFLTI